VTPSGTPYGPYALDAPYKLPLALAAVGDANTAPAPERPRSGAAIRSMAAAGSSRAVIARSGTTREAHPGRMALESEDPTPPSRFLKMRRSIW
jgi:hypothetical protein